MKIIIAGSRTINNMQILINAIIASGFNITSNDEIVSGGAPGVDFLGEIYAKQRKIHVKIFKANWIKYGKSAGVIRNYEMAKYCDKAIVVHNGSNGSKNMIENMKKLKKEVFEYKVEI